MHILGYQGKSLVSRAIRWQTRSPYSHVAVEDDDGKVYEAWHKGGVRCVDHYKQGHTKGTQVDQYALIKDYDKAKVRSFLYSQVGKGYDFKSVFRFLTRRDVRLDDSWFCAEHVGAAFAEGGLLLQTCRFSYLTPRDICMSPHLSFVDTLYV